MRNLEDIKRYIVKNLKPINPKKIILFGSFAYGNPHENSDLDLCIIKDSFSKKREIRREIRRRLEDIEIPMDVLVVDENYYETHSDNNWINTALYDVRHKGEVLYEKK